MVKASAATDRNDCRLDKEKLHEAIAKLITLQNGSTSGSWEWITGEQAMGSQDLQKFFINTYSRNLKYEASLY